MKGLPVGSRLSFPWLAIRSIRLNARFYLPYLLSCAVIVALHYDIQFLNMNTDMEQLPGASSVHGLLSVIVLAVDFFSIFIFYYTNGFLMKRRQREFGLYSILGMERRHLRKLICWESLFCGIVAIGGGLLLGLVLSQSFVMLFGVVMHVDVSFGFEIPRLAVIYTVFIYGCILLANLVVNLVRVSFVRPIVLFRSSEAGDREPRTRWFLAVIGIVTLAAGYLISFFTNPLANLGLFLLAVILVIVATYCLFSSASVAVLKRLRANEPYYYQPRNFFAVASTLHRMRRNAAGLATVCVLSTMALVTASTTFCMYVCADPGIMGGGEQEVRSLVGAYFFVGVFVSVLFLFACALIVYYKQASEGYEDAPSLAIMQQVGMTDDEVDLAIRGRNALTFMPPLVMAACHTLAALPITSRILMAFGITSLMQVVGCTAITLLVYGLLYLLVFRVTSRAYRRIVAWSAVDGTRS